MLLLVTLATCGIVPWDLTTFLVCDFLLSATIVVGAIRRCRRPGKSPGEQSASPQEPPKQPSTPTHGENAKKEPQGELGSYSLGVKAWPNPTAVQVGTSPEFYPGTGRTKNRSQEKELVSARYPQEEAQPTPYKGRRCWCCPPPTGTKGGEQVPGKSTGGGENHTRRTPGSTGGTVGKEPPTRHESVDVSLGELGRRELQDPQKWNKLLSEQSPQEGVTRGEGEEAKGAPPKEQDRRGEKRNPGKEEPAEGGGEPPGKPPGDGDEKEKKSESATTKNLDYAPVCCSCNKQGVEQLKFREDYKSEGELTFCTRIIRSGSTTRLGVCLMASGTGLITTSRGKLCGHVVCPQCLVTKRGRAMCPCCSRKLEIQGAAKGGAGPLPRKEVPPGGEGVKSEQKGSEEEEPDERDRRGRGERKRHRDSSTDSRAPRARRRESRVSDDEEFPSDEEKRNFPPEEAAGSGAHRRDRGSPELTPSQEEDKEPEMEEVTEETAECVISCCNRWTQPGYDTCCEPCEASRGKRHSQMCDRLNKRDPPEDQPVERCPLNSLNQTIGSSRHW